jgi:hypothetical protein
VRRIDGASRNIECFAGVDFTFQISSHSVEPTVASRSSNLFAKDDRRSAGGNKSKEVRPQMPWIAFASLLAGDAKGLAGAGSCPNRSIVSPHRETECVAPAAEAREEVALRVSLKVFGLHVCD